MFVGIIKISLHIPWSHSLKEKRQVIKSIIGKLQARYHVSAAEVEHNDYHQVASIGISFVSTNRVDADKMIERILIFVEMSTDAIIQEEKSEIIYENDWQSPFNDY